MTEDTLAKLAAYRRTWNLIHRWKVPDGVMISVVCFPDQYRVDVIMTCSGITVDAEDFPQVGERETKFWLTRMAELVMARAVEAYDRHEVSDKDDVIMNMTLAQAGRAFDEGIKRVSGKGGGE